MKNLIDFFHKAGALKDLKRSGWKKHDIKNPESVAEHSWRMALIALILAKKQGLDANKAVALAVVHDLAEAVVGDYMPDEVTASQKQQEEHEAIKQFCRDLGADGDILLSLWEEYEFQNTHEAGLVKEVDRLEMALQAKEYELDGKAENLDTFIQSAEEFLKGKSTAELLQDIKELK